MVSVLRRRTPAAVLALALLVPLAGSSTSAPAAGAPSAAPGAQLSAARAGTTRVLAISVDGLNVRALTELGHDGAPNLHRLEAEGAATRNARTERELTVTLPNHTGMLTGRRVNAARGGHGVTWNTDEPGTTVQQAAGHRVDSVFTVVHAAGGSTALFTSKAKFSLFDRSWPRGIDRFRVDERNGVLARATRRDLLRRQRAFTFLHLSLPDVAGHASGFMSGPYLDAVRRVDRLLGGLLATIEADAGLSRDLVVVLTADHGGDGASHSDARSPENYRVPFFVWGPGIAAEDLYALNPDYADPGLARPSYDGRQPVRNGDVANLSTDLLGLGPVRGSELNARQDLDVR